jgi:hypothetical protein
LSRNGHTLRYAFGAEGKIAHGEIQWRDGDDDLPHHFTVTRSTTNPDRFIVDNGDPQELRDIAQLIVREYLEHKGG